MMCLLLSRGLSNVAQAGSIGGAEAPARITRSSIENVDGPESVQRPLPLGCCVFTPLVGRYILCASSSDHGGENENAFFSPFNEAAKRVPCPKSGNVGSIGLLACDEHDVAEA